MLLGMFVVWWVVGGGRRGACGSSSISIIITEQLRQQQASNQGEGVVLLPAELVRLTAHALSSRLSPQNGITCGQSVCDVRV